MSRLFFGDMFVEGVWSIIGIFAVVGESFLHKLASSLVMKARSRVSNHVPLQ